MDLRDELQASLGNQYTFTRELGGGMARVFVATELALHREVVIKVLPPELAAQVSVDRFKREILFAARLQHAHIVQLLTAGEACGLPYYTMPLVAGESLRARLERGDRVPLPEAARMLREVASAVAYAHANGVVHRDIKPANVLISSGAAMVTDFGVAKAVSLSSNAELGSITAPGILLGTPAYMAPEQMAGDSTTDQRADVYSFGVVAYEVLSGGPLFTGSAPHDLVAAHMVKEPEPIAIRAPHIPEALAAVVMHCLAKDPDARPQNGGELMALLDAAITGGARALRVGGLVALKRRSAAVLRRPGVRAGLGLAVVAAIATLVLRDRPPRDSVAPAGPVSARAVAVLPFATVGGDTAVDYFTDGMTEAVATEVAQLPGVRVAARSSAYRYKGPDVNVKDVGRALGVGSVILGSVQRVSRNVRISVQLVSAADGLTLWSNGFEKPVTGVFEVQDQIAVEIARALNVTLASGAASLRGVGTRNVEAYDLHLRAVAAQRKYSEPDLRRSIAMFLRASALDPAFAAPWAGIAKSWINLADDWLPPREAYPKAREAVRRALTLDSTSADAHAMLGTIAFDYEWDVPAAVDHIRRAVALDPGNIDARVQYARALMQLGAPDSALAEGRRALALDPTSANLAGEYAHILIGARMLDSAERWIERERELDPAGPFIAVDFGYLRMAQGRWADALEAYQTETSFAATTEAHRAICEAHLGRPVEARRRLAVLEELRGKRYVAADRIARVYAALGDADGAFRWLERAFTDRAAALVTLTNFTWDPIRKDPRFAELLARIARSRS